MYKQNKIMGVVGLTLGIWLFSVNSQSDSRYGLTNVELNTIISETNDSFDLAEQTIFENKPDIPDDTPLGPHPDINKCACRGTGVITHGDGHKTDCPYHGKDVIPDPEPEPEKANCRKCESRKTYCNCINAYGKCSCRQRRR